MRYDDYELSDIFDKTGGKCHLCKGRLTYGAYGKLNHSRGWEVDHSKPKARGGTDSFRNLKPAHITCNRQKGAMTNSEYRKTLAETSLVEDIFKFLCFMAVIFIAMRAIESLKNRGIEA